MFELCVSFERKEKRSLRAASTAGRLGPANPKKMKYLPHIPFSPKDLLTLHLKSVTMQKGMMIALLLLSLLCGFLIYRTYELENKLNQQTAAKENIPTANGLPVESSPTARSPFDQPANDPEGDQFANQTTALTPPAAAPTTVAFEQTTHDFGKKTNDKKLKTKFRFRNTGNNPLIISQALGSCGCTVPQWPKDPIAPGASGEIYIEFDPKGKTGETTKTISVSANTNPTVTTLSVKATLIPKMD